MDYTLHLSITLVWIILDLCNIKAWNCINFRLSGWFFFVDIGTGPSESKQEDTECMSETTEVLQDQTSKESTLSCQQTKNRSLVKHSKQVEKESCDIVPETDRDIVKEISKNEEEREKSNHSNERADMKNEINGTKDVDSEVQYSSPLDSNISESKSVTSDSCQVQHDANIQSPDVQDAEIPHETDNTAESEANVSVLRRSESSELKDKNEKIESADAAMSAQSNDAVMEVCSSDAGESKMDVDEEEAMETDAIPPDVMDVDPS